MDTLRDEIVREIENAAQGTDLARSTYYDSRTRKETRVIDETADAILALVAERLTSDAAIREAARAANEEDYGVGVIEDEGFENRAGYAYWTRCARAAVTAALRAAGITQGDTPA